MSINYKAEAATIELKRILLQGAIQKRGYKSIKRVVIRHRYKKGEKFLVFFHKKIKISYIELAIDEELFILETLADGLDIKKLTDEYAWDIEIKITNNIHNRGEVKDEFTNTNKRGNNSRLSLWFKSLWNCDREI